MVGAKPLEKLYLNMKKILIIGAGAMGSAFSLPCVENLNKVTLIGTHLETKIINKLKKNRFHPSLKKLLPQKVVIKNYKYLDAELKKKPNYIVIAVSSKGIDWVCEKLIKNYQRRYSLILLTKGLAKFKNKLITISTKINNLFKKNKLPYQDITSIKGPCLAVGLINKVRTSTVIANKKIKNALKVSKLISTNYYKSEVSKDINGVETLGAIKNIYAMLIGASKGLSGSNLPKKIREKYFHNTSSSLFRDALLEMKNFSKKMKGLPETAYGLAGLGDLYVSIAGGRNSMLGYYLGVGRKYTDIKKNIMKKITTEGSDLAIEFGPIIKKNYKKKDFPIMFALINSICKNKILKIEW